MICTCKHNMNSWLVQVCVHVQCNMDTWLVHVCVHVQCNMDTWLVHVQCNMDTWLVHVCVHVQCNMDTWLVYVCVHVQCNMVTWLVHACVCHVGYTSITCSKILNIPYNLILQQNLMIPRFLLRFFHGTIWICRWRMTMLVTSQYQFFSPVGSANQIAVFTSN
jgi:hypothetical protein